MNQAGLWTNQGGTAGTYTRPCNMLCVTGTFLYLGGNTMNFQDMIFALKSFWSSQGCIIYEPYDVEKGAGTMNPATFLRTLGPEPWHVAYVEPSRRPADGRYGDNPNRLYQHHQFQVICKPSPDNIQELYEDRELFDEILQKTGIPRAAGGTVFTAEEAKKVVACTSIISSRSFANRRRTISRNSI